MQLFDIQTGEANKDHDLECVCKVMHKLRFGDPDMSPGTAAGLGSERRK